MLVRVSLATAWLAATALVGPGCGGAILTDGPLPGEDAGEAVTGKQPDASAAFDGASAASCAIGGACTQGTCRPCTDECDGRCGILACANGHWLPVPSPLPPRCASVDAGGPSSVCDLPPVDITGCVTDQDCVKIEKGCYCGARPIFAVNQAYVNAVQACEDDQSKRCPLQCAVMDGYRAEGSSTVVRDPDLIRAICDQTGESGRCVTRLAR